MSRHIFGWSLPPGCSQADIDRAFGGGDECFCADLRDDAHRQLEDQGLDDEAIERRIAEMDAELRCEVCEEREGPEDTRDCADEPDYWEEEK